MLSLRINVFHRVASPTILAAILGVSTAHAQTDTVRNPPPRTVPSGVGRTPPPSTVPGAVCSPVTPAQEKPASGRHGPQILSPLAHLDQVNAITDIPSLNYVVTASNDGTIRVWDSETANQVGLLFSDYTQRILDVAARPRHATEVAASILKFGSLDSHVAIFDLTTGKARTVCSGGGATRLRFSPDGTTLAVLDSWSVSVWDVNTFGLIRRIDGPLTAIQFFDNSTLALHTQDGVVLTQFRTIEKKASIPTGVGTEFVLDLTEGLLFNLNKNVVTVWSLSTSTLLTTVPLFSDVQFLAFDQDQRKLYASGFESVAFRGGARFIYRISGPDWKNVEAFGGPDDRITALAVGGGNLMIGEFNGEVRRFNVREKFEVEPDLGVRAEDITAIATSAGDRYIAAGDRSGVISVWETDSGTYRELDHFNVRKSLAPYFPKTGGRGASEVFTFGEPSPPPFLRVLNLAFLGDSTLLAVAYGSGHTLVIDVLSGKIFVDATISDMGLTNFVSIGSSTLLIGSLGEIHWWNIETGKSGNLAANLHGLSSLALTPDCKKLIVAGDDGVQLFDTTTFSPTVPRFNRRSPGRSIAVATSNGSAVVLSETEFVTWDFTSGLPAQSNLDRGIPKTLTPDLREESSFQVSAKQNRIVMVGSGYGIHIWDSTKPKALRRHPRRRFAL
jgi:WD40 repeat protein